jgi:folate-binding protein YgfZ
MTDSTVAVTPQPTAVAALLEAAHIPHELACYRGALTPRVLDAPETEIAALTQGAALHDLGWMRRVAVRGDDRFRWLSGMVTNTVNDLFPNTGAWNLVLNAQGRILGDLTVWRESEETSPVRRNPIPTPPAKVEAEKLDRCDARYLGTPFAGESGLVLEISNDQLEKLLTHLNRFIIMDDVELVPMGVEPVGGPGFETAIGISGPLADDVLARVGLPTINSPMAAKIVEWNGWDLTIVRVYGAIAKHYEFWLPTAGLAKLWSCLRTGGAIPVGCESVEKLRVVEGVPAYGIDMTEKDLPQETSQMRALHFNKGCYLGQEIVERIRSRGNVHRHLRPLEVTGSLPESGAELKLQDGSVAGHITSAVELSLPKGKRIFALGMVRAETEAASQSLNYASGAATGTAQILAEPPEL